MWFIKIIVVLKIISCSKKEDKFEQLFNKLDQIQASQDQFSQKFEQLNKVISKITNLENQLDNKLKDVVKVQNQFSNIIIEKFKQNKNNQTKQQEIPESKKQVYYPVQLIKSQNIQQDTQNIKYKLKNMTFLPSNDENLKIKKYDLIINQIKKEEKQQQQNLTKNPKIIQCNKEQQKKTTFYEPVIFKKPKQEPIHEIRNDYAQVFGQDVIVDVPGYIDIDGVRVYGQEKFYNYPRPNINLELNSYRFKQQRRQNLLFANHKAQQAIHETMIAQKDAKQKEKKQ